MPTLWLFLFGPVALLLALMVYAPALLLAALARPLLGIKRDDQQSVEDLQKVCGWIWGAVLTVYLLLTK
jgi:hypothetical protein